MLQLIFANRQRRRLLKAPNPRITAARLGAGLFVIFALHIGAMMSFEAMPFFDALWLTSTTIVTVGYGDLSASTVAGRLSTMILLYFCGIYILADAASRFLAYQSNKTERKLKGTWRWNMKDHIVIIGSPRAHPEHFFGKLVSEIDATLDHPEIILLTQSFSGIVPDCITKHNAVHYAGSGHLRAELEAVDVTHARAILILSDDETDITSDSKALDIAERLRDLDFNGHIVVELVNDENRARVDRRKRGCISTIRPARGYPEMLVRAIAAPGSEEILENFFSEAGDEVHRIALDSVLEENWGTVVTRVVLQGCGIPIGYQGSGYNSHAAGVISNPDPRDMISASALFVIVNDRCENAADQINSLFTRHVPLQTA